MLVVRLTYLPCSLKKTVAGAAAMTPIDHASVPGSGQLTISPTKTIRRDFASEQRNTGFTRPFCKIDKRQYFNV